MASIIPPQTSNTQTISLPPIPQWYLVEDHGPREPEQAQLNFLTTALEIEVESHHKARILLHRYLVLFLKEERQQFADRRHIRYLNRVIQDLRTQLQDHKMKIGQLQHPQPCLSDDIALPLPSATFPDYFTPTRPTFERSVAREVSTQVRLSDVERNVIESPEEQKTIREEALVRNLTDGNDDYNLQRLASWAVFESSMQMDTPPQSEGPEWFALDDQDHAGEGAQHSEIFESRNEVEQTGEVLKVCKKRKHSFDVGEDDQHSRLKRCKY